MINTDKIIADLIKGAQQSEGFLRGSRAKVELGGERGQEVKLANYRSGSLHDHYLRGGKDAATRFGFKAT